MERILVAADGLTEEQFNICGHAGHGSIRDTLIHVIETEQSWSLWFSGELSSGEAIAHRIDRDRVQDLAGVHREWEEANHRTQATIEGMSEDDFSRELPLEVPHRPTRHFPLWKLMIHVANHGTQHRSEVAAMLTEHGCSPGFLDMLWYMTAPSPGSARPVKE
ncbi:MAG: DinB family protein [Chloroflexota bacterium]|nr:DinB family protein [Chloroflexota bacterium]